MSMHGEGMSTSSPLQMITLYIYLMHRKSNALDKIH